METSEFDSHNPSYFIMLQGVFWTIRSPVRIIFRPITMAKQELSKWVGDRDAVSIVLKMIELEKCAACEERKGTEKCAFCGNFACSDCRQTDQDKRCWHLRPNGYKIIDSCDICKESFCWNCFLHCSTCTGTKCNISTCESKTLRVNRRCPWCGTMHCSDCISECPFCNGPMCRECLGTYHMCRVYKNIGQYHGSSFSRCTSADSIISKYENVNQSQNVIIIICFAY